MKSGKMRNLKTGLIVGECVWKADTFWNRLRGLMGGSRLETGEGLWLIPCQQVHMVGMKFSLSVWFLDQSGHVCALIDDLPRGKISPRVKNSVSVIEFTAGWGIATNTLIGDEIRWEEL